MGSPAATNLRRLLLAVLAVYALMFVALSLDILVRVWDWRGRFESPADMAALLYFEGIRAVTTLAGVAIALWAAAAVRSRDGLRELPFALLLGTITYTKLVAFRGFPGEQQERFARWLQGADVPPAVLEVVFAQPAWTAWGALAACLLLVAWYPRRLTASDIDVSGAADRRGAMRDIALAGTDVGALSRRFAARFATSVLVRPAVLYPVAIAAGLTHALAARSLGVAVHIVALLVAAPTVAALVSMFRAAYGVGDGEEQPPLDWLRRAVLAGGALFAVAGIAAFALRGGNVIAVAALSLAPAAVLVGVTMALRRMPPRSVVIRDTGGRLHRN